MEKKVWLVEGSFWIQVKEYRYARHTDKSVWIYYDHYSEPSVRRPEHGFYFSAEEAFAKAVEIKQKEIDSEENRLKRLKEQLETFKSGKNPK